LYENQQEGFITNFLIKISIRKSLYWGTKSQYFGSFFTQQNYRVGALSWSNFVFVLLAGKGVGALEAKYGVEDGMVGENAEKYSAQNCTTSSGFLNNRNCKKSAKILLSSGCDLM
jgi:hypothetical protein